VAADETPTAEPSPCTACRATGKVISNLGGSPSTIDCPWCEGTGTFIAEHDAQGRFKTDQTASEAPSDS